MNIKEFAESVPLRRIRRPVHIEFVNGITEQVEGYVEYGMRATVLEVVPESGEDGVYIIKLSFKLFDDYNKAFEASNYYDNKHVPCLTARQAGLYKEEIFLYVMEYDDISKYFRVLDSEYTKLMDQYIAEKSDLSYTMWLEKKVTQLILVRLGDNYSIDQ